MFSKAVKVAAAAAAVYQGLVCFRYLTNEDHTLSNEAVSSRSERQNILSTPVSASHFINNEVSFSIYVPTSYSESKQGLYIYWQKWEPKGEAKGVVILSHGLGEHSSRFVNFFVKRFVVTFP